MTESEFILAQERIDNVEARCDALHKDLAEYAEANPSDDWLEKRVMALEDQVRLLIHCTKSLQGKGEGELLERVRLSYHLEEEDPHYTNLMKEFEEKAEKLRNVTRARKALNNAERILKEGR